MFYDGSRFYFTLHPNFKSKTLSRTTKVKIYRTIIIRSMHQRREPVPDVRAKKLRKYLELSVKVELFGK